MSINRYQYPKKHICKSNVKQQQQQIKQKWVFYNTAIFIVITTRTAVSIAGTASFYITLISANISYKAKASITSTIADITKTINVAIG